MLSIFLFPSTAVAGWPRQHSPACRVQQWDCTGWKLKRKLLSGDRVYRHRQGIPVTWATPHLFFLKKDAVSEGESLREKGQSS